MAAIEHDKVHIKDDPGLILTYFMARSNLFYAFGFLWGNYYKVILKMAKSFSKPHKGDSFLFIFGPLGVFCRCLRAINM